MKNTKWMKEMTSAELAEAIKNGTDTVIIPGGAYEVYGPQLPLGSDTIVSLAVCERVAAKTNAIIASRWASPPPSISSPAPSRSCLIPTIE